MTVPERPPGNSPETPELDANSAHEEAVVDLPSGNELDELAAAELQGARLVRLIVVAGPVGAGKTTLVTTLHDLFQEGGIGNYSFAWSHTLPAFERRCHFSRTASERATADTERTPYGKVRYLHVRISGPDLRNNPLDLLFTDVSGETFERARDSISECQQLAFLKMADHFLLLIDCEKLVDRKKRNQVIHDSMLLLRSCLDSGMLASTSFVKVLWTKHDFIVAAENGEHAAFLETATEEFKRQFGSRVGKLSFTKVAARPLAADKLEFGYGVPGLLKEWADESPRDRAMNLVPDEQMGSRESEKFLERHFQGTQEPQK
jgi:hypothetical protein